MHPNTKRAALRRLDAYARYLRDVSEAVTEGRVGLADWLKKDDLRALPPKKRKIFKEILDHERTLRNAAIAIEWTLDDYEELY